MGTAFKRIADGLLVSLSALAGGQVALNRLRPISSAQPTALVLRLGRSQGQEVVLGAIDWQTSFAVECYGRGVTGADPADAVDSLLLQAWAILAAIDCAAIGASDLTLNPSVEWQYDEAETPLACATLQLSVSHRTPGATLTPWS